MVDVDTKASSKRYSLLCLGKEFLGQKQKRKTRVTQFQWLVFFTVLKKKMIQIN